MATKRKASRTRRLWTWWRRKVRRGRARIREAWESATVESKTASVHGWGWSATQVRPVEVGRPIPGRDRGAPPRDPKRVEAYRAVFDNQREVEFEVYAEDDTDVVAAAWHTATQNWGFDTWGMALTYIEPCNGLARARIGAVGFAPQR